MKKLFTIILIFILASCSTSKEVSIVCPTGAPSLAFLNEIDNPNFETNSVATNIVSLMSNGSDKDIVVIDTLSGVKAIKNGAPYKLAATITFGNFFIAATGTDDNNLMDKGDKIVIFGQGMTPDVIFHLIFNNEFDDSIEYVNAVADAGKVLASSKNFESGSTIDYVFIAEPVLSTILNNKDALTYGKASIYMNIQDEYKKLTGSELVQASLFIKDGFNDKDYLNRLNENINKLLNDENYVNELIADKDSDELSTIYGLNSNLIVNVLNSNSINLGFKGAYDNLEAINFYLNLFNEEGINEEEIYK